jgi:hypothetical protein
MNNNKSSSPMIMQRYTKATLKIPKLQKTTSTHQSVEVQQVKNNVFHI